MKKQHYNEDEITAIKLAAAKVEREALIRWWTREIDLLDEQIRQMGDYLALVTARADHHGVMDAAADIRELTAKRSVFMQMTELVRGSGCGHRIEDIERLLFDSRVRFERTRIDRQVRP